MAQFSHRNAGQTLPRRHRFGSVMGDETGLPRNHVRCPMSRAILYSGLLFVPALLLLACDTDSFGGEFNHDANQENQANICDWGPCDEPGEPDPRDENELPGGEGRAGEDPCGDDGYCHWEAHGPSTNQPFLADDLSGALIDENGFITLDDSSEQRYFIWIANTDQGTISKIDTESHQEVARYRTGPPNTDLQPSRTTVNGSGQVFVANRQGQSVTKIGLSPDCPTQSGDGSPVTSSGPNDILDWGDDECVLWHTELPGYGVVRALAAQDTEDGSYVWVGGWDHSIWKLDARTGAVIFRTTSPVHPYGFALDEAGNLWIATFSGQQLGRIDTNRCRDHASCQTTVCEQNGDDCVKEIITTPANGYGITVDQQQRVWVGGDIMRYDPQAPSGQRWAHVDPGPSIHGIAADDDGYIYAAAMGEGILRFDAEDLSRSTTVSQTAGRSVKGVAVDFHGRIWGINVDHNTAFVVEPGPGLYDGQVIHTAAGLDGPYTYSDMTGSQLRFATDQRGVWRTTFEGCHPNYHVYHEWQTLRFVAEAEGGSELEWRIRAAEFASQLPSTNWISLGMTPPLSSPIDIRAKLAALGLARAHYLQVEVRMRPERDGDDFYVPRVEAVDVIAECPPIVL